MHLFKRLSVFVSLIVMLTLNALAVLLPLNQVTTKELSDAIPTYFVPAGYVFSIWSVIYIALVAYAIYQLLPQARKLTALHGIAWLFVINAFANAGWIILWHYRFVELSVLLMLVILVTLIAIYVRMQIGLKTVSWVEWCCTHFPFSLYFGWISVATIANISAALYVRQWNGFGLDPQVWSAIMLVTAGLLGSLMLWLRRDYVYAGVIAWAVIGIALKFSNVALISMTAWAVVAVLAVLMVVVKFLAPREPIQLKH